jgi:hypothetical protein
MTDSPKPPDRDGEDAFRGHRTRDAALVLPLAGLALVVPPVVNLFVGDGLVLGVPLIGVYLFAVWAALIAAAAGLAHRLRRDPPP